MPQVQVSQYLPEAPSCPKIPLPEQVQVVVDRAGEINDENVSPLIQRLNLTVLTFSLLCILGGRSISDYLVFTPSYLVSMEGKQQEGDAASTGSTIPYVWTPFTCIFIEESLIFLFGQLAVINFIVYKNRRSFEGAWQTRDLYIMLAVASFCSLTTQLLIRLSIVGVFKNVESYKACRYSGLNFIVMALLLGLRQ